MGTIKKIALPEDISLKASQLFDPLGDIAPVEYLERGTQTFRNLRIYCGEKAADILTTQENAATSPIFDFNNLFTYDGPQALLLQGIPKGWATSYFMLGIASLMGDLETHKRDSAEKPGFNQILPITRTLKRIGKAERLHMDGEKNVELTDNERSFIMFGGISPGKKRAPTAVASPLALRRNIGEDLYQELKQKNFVGLSDQPAAIIETRHGSDCFVLASLKQINHIRGVNEKAQEALEAFQFERHHPEKYEGHILLEGELLFIANDALLHGRGIGRLAGPSEVVSTDKESRSFFRHVTMRTPGTTPVEDRYRGVLLTTEEICREIQSILMAPPPLRI